MPGSPETLWRLTDEIQLRVSPALAVAIKRALISADERTLSQVDPELEARADQANALCGR
jgi:hypothetical protein